MREVAFSEKPHKAGVVHDAGAQTPLTQRPTRCRHGEHQAHAF